MAKTFYFEYLDNGKVEIHILENGNIIYETECNDDDTILLDIGNQIRELEAQGKEDLVEFVDENIIKHFFGD